MSKTRTVADWFFVRWSRYLGTRRDGMVVYWWPRWGGWRQRRRRWWRDWTRLEYVRGMLAHHAKTSWSGSHLKKQSRGLGLFSEEALFSVEVFVCDWTIRTWLGSSGCHEAGGRRFDWAIFRQVDAWRDIQQGGIWRHWGWGDLVETWDGRRRRRGRCVHTQGAMGVGLWSFGPWEIRSVNNGFCGT